MSAKTHVTLLKDEIIIDSWDLYYTFENGLNFFGRATITNKRILFETKIQECHQAMLAASEVFTNHTQNHVILAKKHIKKVDCSKDSSGNKIFLVLKNGETHILDRKMLSIDKIAEALMN